MREVVVDNALVFGSPVPVPDNVDGGRCFKHRSVIVVNVTRVAVAVRWRLLILVERP